jgi:hypothetical protein
MSVSGQNQKSSVNPQTDAPDPKRSWRSRLLDHLVGAQQDQWRDGEAERLGGFEVND